MALVESNAVLKGIVVGLKSDVIWSSPNKPKVVVALLFSFAFLSFLDYAIAHLEIAYCFASKSLGFVPFIFYTSS